MREIKKTISFFLAISQLDFLDKMRQKWLDSEHPEAKRISAHYDQSDPDGKYYHDFTYDIDETKGTWYIHYTNFDGGSNLSKEYKFETFMEEYFSTKIQELETQIEDFQFSNRNLVLADEKFKEFTEQLNPAYDEANKIEWITRYPFVLTRLHEALIIVKKARRSFKAGQKSNLQAKKIYCTLTKKEFPKAIRNMVDKLQPDFLPSTGEVVPPLKRFLKGEPANPDKKIPWIADFVDLRYFIHLLDVREFSEKRARVNWDIVTEYFMKDDKPILPEQLRSTRDPKDPDRKKRLRDAVKLLDMPSTSEK